MGWLSNGTQSDLCGDRTFKIPPPLRTPKSYRHLHYKPKTPNSMRRSATGVKHYSAAVLLGLPQSSSGQDMHAASSFEGLRMWGNSSMKIGKIFSKLVRHVPKPYSQPIMPRRDVWSLFPGSPWASVAAIHRRRDHKAAAGSAVSFGSRNSHGTRASAPLPDGMEGVEQSDVIEVTSIPGTVDAVTSDYRFQSPTTHNLALDSSRMTGAPVYEARPIPIKAEPDSIIRGGPSYGGVRGDYFASCHFL